MWVGLALHIVFFVCEIFVQFSSQVRYPSKRIHVNQYICRLYVEQEGCSSPLLDGK